MYQQHQNQSNNPSTRRNFSLPEPSAPAPINPPPQLLARDRLNVIGENHAESDKRRDVEQQFCYEQTGSIKYFEEYEFKTEDYIPKPDHHGRKLPDSRDGADPMKLRMIQDICFILRNLMNVKCEIEEQNFDITPDIFSKDLNQYSEMLRDEYLDTFNGLDGFEFKASQTEEAFMELGSKIKAIHKSSTNISNTLKSSEFQLEQLNTT
jgi:hypothetical protein